MASKKINNYCPVIQFQIPSKKEGSLAGSSVGVSVTVAGLILVGVSSSSVVG